VFRLGCLNKYGLGLVSIIWSWVRAAYPVLLQKDVGSLAGCWKLIEDWLQQIVVDANKTS
jgi:hypothetical protein